MLSNDLTNPNPSIKWIATLRGIFVLLVFISHQFTSVIDKDVLLAVGKTGVAGFFLLSGYLAMTSIERRTVKQFLLNRFVRLYPVYWLLLLCTVFTLKFTDGRIWTTKEVIANMTFFHQYMGFDSILGASWMMSIMVIFFVLTIFSVKKTSKTGWLFILFIICAILCAYMRFHYHKPFPTAIFLMTCMGWLGYFYHKYGICKQTVGFFLLFETALAISCYLSYQSMLVFYLLAYNGAFLFFIFFSFKNIDIKVFDKLGELGFTFFLGAGIPKMLLSYFVPSLKMNFSLFLIGHFVACIIFSYLVTKFIETPIIQKSKKLESRIL